MPTDRTYQFDNICVEAGNFRLLRDGQPVALEPKAFQVLVYLLENRGRLVEKDELLDRVWAGSFVTPNALTRVVAQLRKALEDDARESRFIETVPTRGYRFAGDVVCRETEATVPGPGTDSSVPGPARARLLPRVLPAAIAALVLPALLLVWMRAPAVDTPSVPAVPRTSQLTTSPGLDAFPAFSPAGDALAYCSDRTGSFEIYVRQAAAKDSEIRVTADGMQNFQPAWSPDGSHLVYHSRKRGGIWVVPALGGAPRQVSRFGSRPAWSPDGSTLVFQSQGVTDLSPMAFGAMPPSVLWLVPGGGGAARQLTRIGEPVGGHGSPTWSPDGRRVIFISNDLNLAELWSVAADGGDLFRLTESPVRPFDPIYAPGGDAVYYFGTATRSSYFIWKLPLSTETGRATGPATELANTGPVMARHLAVSRDGSALVYCGIGMKNDLWSLAMAPDGTAAGPPRPLTRDTAYRKTMPAFSPDGGKIAYSHWVTGSNSFIRMMNADGTGVESLTGDTAGEGAPQWYPDGDRILFFSRRTPDPGFWIRRLRTGTEEPLSFGADVEKRISGKGVAERATYLRLSPDGTRFAFNNLQEGAINVWVLRLGSWPPLQVTFDAELTGFPAWSPDGSMLAAERKHEGSTHIVVVPADGSAIPRQLTSEPGETWPYSWSPDGRRIAFAGSRDGLWNIGWVAVDGSRQLLLTRQQDPSVYVRSPDWSPRGDQIVYEHAQVLGNIWRMELR